MTTDATIRRATSTDAALVAELIATAFTLAGGTPFWPMWRDPR